MGREMQEKEWWSLDSPARRAPYWLRELGRYFTTVSVSFMLRDMGMRRATRRAAVGDLMRKCR